MTEHRSPIPARVYNAAVGGHVCGPDDIDFGQKVVHLIKYDKDGNEVSFESQVTQANKIYVIHDAFTLSSNVTIPANCVLEFDGGSINGGNNWYQINLNSAPLQGSPKLISCNISNPYQKLLKFSWLGISNEDAAYNTTMLNLIGKKVIDWYVDEDCTINDVITITTRINISGPSSQTERMKTIRAASSAGLLFTCAEFNNNIIIENFKIVALNNAIEFTGYAYDITLRYLQVQSNQGNAITFDRNFQVHLMDSWVSARNGYGVDHLISKTSSITRVSAGCCKAVYHNCITTWYDCNAVWNKDLDDVPGTTKNWYLWDSDVANYSIILNLINCNIEDIVEIPILSTVVDTANSFYINGISTNIYTYKNSVTGKREYPAIKVGTLIDINGIHLAGGDDDWADGIQPIMLTRDLHPAYPICNWRFDGFNYMAVKAPNGEGVYTSNINRMPTYKRPTNPLEGFTYFDLTVHKLVSYNGTAWVDATGASV